MNSGSLDRLARVFADAQQLPPDKRHPFVVDACGADPDLCTQVLSLLQASDEADQFLAAPALDALAREVAADGWSLRRGDQVGVYSVTQLIGAGGTGEVWRAHDDRLGRDVALKVLLPHLVRDPGLTRRFAEEARAAGALNHPNILTVYDVGEHRGSPFIVAEHLEGESLRRRLRAGPLSPEDALAIGADVAAGLAAAHARGIIHRDLKPDNIFLMSGGGVKILDFGLAKLYTPAEGTLVGDRLTLTGVIVGTAGYMAPEQARGQPVDPRTDLFALGATMYEMLAGRRAFVGASTVEALHAILSTDPPALRASNPRISQTLARIVERLLEKEPADRFQSASEVREALDRSAHEPGGARHAPFAIRRLLWPLRTAALVAAAALVGGGWWIRGRPPQDEALPVAQFTWPLPGQLGLDAPPVMSPDGQSLVFVGVDASTRRIYLRPLRSLEATPIAGTDGGQQPFWSPDSRAIGFFARGKLLTIGLSTGLATALADAPDPHGGSWGTSGQIVFAPQGATTPLLTVPARGGPSRQVTLVDRTAGDTAHRWPVFLPDGTHFVYFADGAEGGRGMRLGRTDRSPSGSDALVMASESAAAFVPRPDGQGVLLAAAGSSVAVGRLDSTFHLIDGLKTLPIAVGGGRPASGARLSASETALAFAAVTPPGVRLGSVNRDGTALSLAEEREVQDRPRVSPDGRLLARQRADSASGRIGIWVEDLATGARQHVSGADEATHPVWSPDGRRLAYATGPRAAPHLAVVAADGRGVVVTLRCPGAYCEPTDWSPDGQQLIVNVRGVNGADVWAVWLDAESARPLLADPSIERDARLSPDGKWVAFVTEQSGAPQVKVRRTTGTSPSTTISLGSGDRPVWRRDGRELFFVDGQHRLRVVTIGRGPGDTLTFGAPFALEIPPFDGAGPAGEYDLSPDGHRIYFLRRVTSALPREIRIVVGWQKLLR